MHEERVQRIAAFLAEIFDAGSAMAEFDFGEAEVLLDASGMTWYDQLAHELREEYTENPETASHNWPLFERQARALLAMLYDA